MPESNPHSVSRQAIKVTYLKIKERQLVQALGLRHRRMHYFRLSERLPHT